MSRKKEQPELPEKEKQVFAAIKAFWKANGYSPSLKELSEAVGTDVTAVNIAVHVLESKGLIKREPKIARSIRIV